MNSWNKSLQVGTQGELEVVEYINKIRPEWKLERIAGANELDAQSIHGGWEIKTYADWYRNPLIEVSCLSGVGDTMWLKDKRIKIIIYATKHINNTKTPFEQIRHFRTNRKSIFKKSEFKMFSVLC